MAFSLENPGFSIDVCDQVDVHQLEFFNRLGIHRHLENLLDVPASTAMGG